MILKDYNELLYEKASAEYNDFISNLKGMSPEIIISRAYEKVIKEDILVTLESKDLEQNEAKALYLKKCPIEHIYQEWLSNDLGHMEMIEDTIKECAEKTLKENKIAQKESR